MAKLETFKMMYRTEKGMNGNYNIRFDVVRSTDIAERKERGWNEFTDSDQLYKILKWCDSKAVFYYTDSYSVVVESVVPSNIYTDSQGVWMRANGGSYVLGDFDNIGGYRKTFIRVGLTKATDGIFNEAESLLNRVQGDALQKFKDICKHELELQAILNNKSLNKKPSKRVLPTLEEQLTNDEWWATLSEEEKSEVRKMVG